MNLYFISFDISEGAFEENIQKYLEQYFKRAHLISRNEKAIFYRTKELEKLNEQFGDPWRDMVEVRNQRTTESESISSE